ncbi:hypothetical protein [Ralstonia sp.]|uniref:hypothetical protein n=1 Tax=Ralstonia sp. TaxID=54061 RepID=UPI002C0E50DD|nr:hypothetical protein [Ralstonia sp.]HWV04225.1 hypothetical protein [Ralstonia sp.]
MTDKTGVLDSFHLGEVLKGSARKLGERCGPAAVEMLSRRFADCIGQPDEDRYSYLWRSAIEEHPQDAHKDSFRAVLVDAIRDVTLGALSTNRAESLNAVRGLLESPYPTLVRIGIYVCGEDYGHTGVLFWECAKPDWFLNLAYWHELFWLIKKAFTRFSTSERSQYLAIVDNVHGNWSDPSRQEEWDETHRRDLLHPAYGLGDPEVDKKYSALVERWGPVREHPDFHSYTTTGWVGDRSPVESDALVGMSNDELLKLLREFVPEGRMLEGPTYRGLASALSEAVRASEDGFASRIPLFTDVRRPYQHGLLRGLIERLTNDKRQIDWAATLSLVQSITSSPSFKIDMDAEQPEAWEPSVKWVLGDIADLIKAASNKERRIASGLRNQCVEILKTVLAATSPKEAGDSSDAVSQAINSPRGRALEALILTALAMRRDEAVHGQAPGAIWAKIEPLLDAELVSSNSGRNAEFATLCGIYCANLHYLNPEWTTKNFDRLFSISSDTAWRCTAQGFAYQNYLYDWLFAKLVDGGHLRRMVYTEGLPDQVADRALQFLGLAYLESKDEFNDDGLLAELITNLRVKELSKLCWFFWTVRSKEGTSQYSSKVLAFWKRIAEQIAQSGTTAPDLQSALNQLAPFIDDLTQPLAEVWAAAAAHAHVKYNGPVLVENLARLADRNPQEVAAVFRAALSSFVPDFPPQDVIRCVTKLADAGRRDDAEQICNIYSERGSQLLKETYHELREQQRALEADKPSSS